VPARTGKLRKLICNGLKMRNLKVMWRLAFTFSLLLALALLAVGAAVLGMRDLERHAATLEVENAALLNAAATVTGGQGTAAAIADLQALLDATRAKARERSTAGRDAVRRAQLLVAAVVAFGVALGVAATWAVTRGIVRPLHFAARTAERVAEGDLRRTVRRAYRDETGRVVLALGDMQDKLNTLVRAIRDSAGSVHAAAERISGSNTDLATRTGQQAAALQQTAANVGELTATVTRNTEGAGTASDLAREACALAEGSGEAVSGVAQRMQQIVKASRNVSDIVGVMDEIAFQTNLLALNAAVEAARAGEQGRGFAVVAAQVRVLAQRSAEAARDIKGLVNQAVGEADHGAREARQAGEAMAGVVRVVREVARLVTEIARASEEQRAGIQQVNATVGHMDAGTQSNAKLVQEINGYTRLLLAQASELMVAASRFRLDDADGAAPALHDAPAPAALGWRPASA
jgi:methyl-accepting chemotaxis protein